jgi:hypothetical protein
MNYLRNYLCEPQPTPTINECQDPSVLLFISFSTTLIAMGMTGYSMYLKNNEYKRKLADNPFISCNGLDVKGRVFVNGKQIEFPSASVVNNQSQYTLDPIDLDSDSSSSSGLSEVSEIEMTTIHL